MSEILIKSPSGLVPFESFNSDPLTVFDVRPSGTATAKIDFEGTEFALGGDSGCRITHSAQATYFSPLVEGLFGFSEYVVMYDNIVEIVGTNSDPFLSLNGSYQPGVWVDAEGAFIRMLDQVSTPGHEHVYSCDVHFYLPIYYFPPIIPPRRTSACASSGD